MEDRTAVYKVAWVHTYCSFFHQPILPVLSIHGERLPYHKAGTHYTYDKTGNLADSTEIENDHKNEEASSPPAKRKRYCAFKPLNSTVRPTPLLISNAAIALQEETSQDSGSHDEEDTRTEPRGCGLARIGVTT